GCGGGGGLRGHPGGGVPGRGAEGGESENAGNAGPGGGNPPQGGGNPGGGGGDQDRNAIRVWKLDSGEVISTLAGHTNRVTQLAVSSDSKTALSVSTDDTVALWDLTQGKSKVRSPKLPYHVQGAAMAADAKRALIVYPGAIVKLSLANFAPYGKPILIAQLLGTRVDDAVRAEAISPDHK